MLLEKRKVEVSREARRTKHLLRNVALEMEVWWGEMDIC